MNPPRLMMTTDAVGGVWSYATDLSSSLCARGWSVTLVTMGPPPSAAQLAPLTELRGLQIVVTDLALEWQDPAAADMERARRTLMRIADCAQPDVVHLNSYREAAFEWPVPCIVVAHSCVWSWWEACRGGTPDTKAWSAYRQNICTGLESAKAWIAPSAAYAAEIARIYRPRTQPIVIHNGDAPAAAARGKKPVILAAGRLWDEAKNLPALHRIAPHLKWPVRVAGPLEAPGAPSSGTAMSSLTALGALERRQLANEMSAAGIFVSLARYEPFGLTVLEAAARGCALVLSDIPTFRELWDGAASFVSPGDDGEARDVINALCEEPRLRHDMQERARVRSRHYSLQRQVHSYEQLYQTLAAGQMRTAGPVRDLQEMCA